MDILILAGGRCRPDLAEASGAEWRCDIPLGSQTFLERTIEAAAGLGSLVVVGPRPVPDARIAEPGEGFVQSLTAGLAQCQAPDVLVVTADMPWISRESLEGFLERRPQNAELAYPIVRAEDCERRFPGLPRTSVALKEGRFTGGNAAWATRIALAKVAPVIEKAYRLRKSPLGLGSMIGWDLVFKLLLSRLSPSVLPISEVEAKAGRFLGVRVGAVLCPHPEIGADIDSAEQYRIMQALQKAAN